MDFKPEQQTLFDLPSQGEVLPVTDQADFDLAYRHPNGQLYQGDSFAWLKSLDTSSVALIVAGPPYNIKKADWDKFENQEEYIVWSMQWLKEAARILRDTGTLYICGFSEILADLKHPARQYFKACRWLIWSYKNKAN